MLSWTMLRSFSASSFASCPDRARAGMHMAESLSTHFAKTWTALLMAPMGLLISWQTPATSCPKEAIFSFITSWSCVCLSSRKTASSSWFLRDNSVISL